VHGIGGHIVLPSGETLRSAWPPHGPTTDGCESTQTASIDLHDKNPTVITAVRAKRKFGSGRTIRRSFEREKGKGKSTMPNPVAVAGGACAIALTMTLGTATLEPRPVSPNISPVASRQPAPALSLKDAKGVSQKLSNYKGRVVLGDFDVMEKKFGLPASLLTSFSLF
jgi:hypothetical protein